MKQSAAVSMARVIMTEFAGLTGLSPAGKVPRRYLWTDAFAVCNFLGLYQQTGDRECKPLALRLIDQVHSILGRHRADDTRSGWISGLDEQQGNMHPTLGGLRIGKEMNERGSGEPYDDQLEWERDGQYYHYLTKWMHALNRAGAVTHNSTYHRWAVELAKTVHARFTYAPLSGGQRRIYWKMSIDLSHPHVSAMGHHDPLDGFITYLQLQAASAGTSHPSTELDLSAEIADLARMCEGKNWATDDPLGLGELLSSSCKLAQLIFEKGLGYEDLLENVLQSSLLGLQSYERSNQLAFPADYRLAFRELGLSIGLHAAEKLAGLIRHAPGDVKTKPRLQSRADHLMNYMPLRDRIETHWLEPANWKLASWTEHRDINMVMLATSLAPDGYLTR